MRNLYYLSLLFFVFLAAACGEDDEGEMEVPVLITESFNLGAFTSIQAQSEIRVIYDTTPGPQSIVLEAIEERFEDVTVELVSGRLHVSYANAGFLRSDEAATLRVTSPQPIDTFLILDKSFLNVEGVLDNDFLYLEATEESILTIDMDVAFLTIMAETEAEFQLSGAASRTDAILDTRADVFAFDLSTNFLNIRLFGDSRADFTVNSTLEAFANGSSLRYRGNPNVLSAVEVNGGSIVNLN